MDSQQQQGGSFWGSLSRFFQPGRSEVSVPAHAGAVLPPPVPPPPVVPQPQPEYAAAQPAIGGGVVAPTAEEGVPATLFNSTEKVRQSYERAAGEAAAARAAREGGLSYEERVARVRGLVQVSVGALSEDECRLVDTLLCAHTQSAAVSQSLRAIVRAVGDNLAPDELRARDYQALHDYLAARLRERAQSLRLLAQRRPVRLPTVAECQRPLNPRVALATPRRGPAPDLPAPRPSTVRVRRTPRAPVQPKGSTSSFAGVDVGANDDEYARDSGFGSNSEGGAAAAILNASFGSPSNAAHAGSAHTGLVSPIRGAAGAGADEGVSRSAAKLVRTLAQARREKAGAADAGDATPLKRTRTGAGAAKAGSQLAESSVVGAEEEERSEPATKRKAAVGSDGTARVEEKKEDTPVAPAAAAANLFTFGTAETKKDEKKDEPKIVFSFGTTDATKDDKKAPFSFGPADTKKEEKKDDAKTAFSFGTTDAKKDGKKDEEPKTTFSFGTVETKKDDKKEEPKAVFSFGTTDDKKDDAKTAFSFGTTDAKKDDELKTAFSFGTTETKNDDKKTPFAFGTTEAKKDDKKEEEPKTTFSFGTVETKKDDKKEEEAKNLFAFGTSEAKKEDAKTLFSFGTGTTANESSTAKKDDEASKQGTTAPSFGGSVFSFKTDAAPEKPEEKKADSAAPAPAFSFSEPLFESPADTAKDSSATPTLSFGAPLTVGATDSDSKKQDTVAPAAPAEKKDAPVFSFGNTAPSGGASAVFSFGNASSGESDKKEAGAAPAPASAFSFGAAPSSTAQKDKKENPAPAAPAAEKKADSPASAFSFGGQTTGAAPSFSFGASPAAPADAPAEKKTEAPASAFSFGSATTGASPSFSFGIPTSTTAAPEAKKEEAPAAVSATAPSSASPSIGVSLSGFGVTPPLGGTMGTAAPAVSPAASNPAPATKPGVSSMPFSFGTPAPAQSAAPFSFGTQPAPNEDSNMGEEPSAKRSMGATTAVPGAAPAAAFSFGATPAAPAAAPAPAPAPAPAGSLSAMFSSASAAAQPQAHGFLGGLGNTSVKKGNQRSNRKAYQKAPPNTSISSNAPAPSPSPTPGANIGMFSFHQAPAPSAPAWSSTVPPKGIFG